MPQITAWKCETSGKLFEFERDYKTHRRRIERQIVERNTANLRLEQAKEGLADLYKQQNLDEIREWLLANSPALIEFYKARGGLDHSVQTRTQLLQLRFETAVWTPTLSNSHNAPFGKRTNFCGQRKDEPRSYPGWSSRIVYTTFPRSTPLDLFRYTGINLGGGGGGEHECFIFDLDFPTMAMLQAFARSPV